MLFFPAGGDVNGLGQHLLVRLHVQNVHAIDRVEVLIARRGRSEQVGGVLWFAFPVAIASEKAFVLGVGGWVGHRMRVRPNVVSCGSARDRSRARDGDDDDGWLERGARRSQRRWAEDREEGGEGGGMHTYGPSDGGGVIARNFLRPSVPQRHILDDDVVEFDLALRVQADVIDGRDVADLQGSKMCVCACVR